MQLSSSKQKFIQSLHLKKFREANGMFLAEGVKTVRDLRSSGMKLLLLTYTEAMQDAASEIAAGADEHYLATELQMKKLSALATAPGILGVFAAPAPASSDQLPPDRWILALDGISDPGNMGTMIRTAHWFGIRDILLCGSFSDPFSPKCVQATMGSLGAARFYTATDAAIAALQAPIYTTALDGENIYDLRPVLPGIIVMGSESHGIGPAWERITTARPLTIPAADSSDHPDSLNVSIAAAIVMGQLVNSGTGKS